MADVRNADSDRLMRGRIEELEDQMRILAESGNKNTKEYRQIQREHSRELRKTSKDFNDSFSKNVINIGQSLNDFKASLDRTIRDYIGSIEQLSYSLNGNIRGYDSVVSNLNRVLNSQNLVSQEKAFKNLTQIIHDGIINNAEQKAFLQTLASDFDMQFNVGNDTMRQLIRIQGEDSTANRMAIEYSLNEFLVQNYQTGEYIRKGFESVSNALLQSQSTMSAAMAASYESTVQTWMGSLYSVGLNGDTISQLAKAIDAVGSGNIKDLGSGVSNLVLMGAARAGLDYGELLNRGFQGNDVNRLMSGITGYITEMSGNSSNVVMSQMANLFGLQLSDIMALRNNRINVAGGANANAEAMLRDATGLVPGVVRMMNGLNNFQYGWGANIASNENSLLTYEVARRFMEPLGGLVSDLGDVIGSGGGLVRNFIGKGVGVLGGLMSHASLLTLLPQLFSPDNPIANILNGGLLGGVFNSNNGNSALDI